MFYVQEYNIAIEHAKAPVNIKIFAFAGLLIIFVVTIHVKYILLIYSPVASNN